jgi:xylulokinase
MLLDPVKRSWSAELCKLFDIDERRLPEVRTATEPIGAVTRPIVEGAGLSSETLVVLGCGDEMAATLGAGVTAEDDVCDVLGTAEAVCSVTHTHRKRESSLLELHPHAEPDAWLLENPGWLSGGAYEWFQTHFAAVEEAAARSTRRDRHDLLEELATESPAGADGLIWLPCLGGAMAPEWNPDARGVWFGLSSAHGRSHLLRAMHEGNAFAVNDVVGELQRMGVAPQRIVCVGGGSHSRLLRQIRADVTGLTVGRCQDVETTARGAAMIASVGAGLASNTAEAVSALAGPICDEIEPNSEVVELYKRSYARYRDLYHAVSPVFAHAGD